MRQAGIRSAAANFTKGAMPFVGMLFHMDNLQVAEYIVQLKDKAWAVRWKAFIALGEIGDPCAIPALIEALKDKDGDVRADAANALRKIGDSDTLPRKILADTRLSAQERIDVLERLRRVRYNFPDSTLPYTFPKVRALCQIVLNDKDAEAHEGAQVVLNWLHGDQDLLIASQPNTASQALALVRPAQGRAFETQPKTLLVPADEPESGAKR